VAPTGQVLSDLADALRARGHQVEVVHSHGGYGGRALPGRVLAEAAFFARSWGAARRGPRPDLVLSLTTPPFIGLVGRAAARRRGAAHAHWVMDVYPDALAAHGWISAGGGVYRALRALARRQLRGAAQVIALGDAQRDRVAPYAEGPLATVPLWSAATAPASPADVERARADRGWAEGELVLLHCGNLGRGHRVEEFLEAARRRGATGPRWAFAGGGARVPEVRSFAGREPQARIQVLPYVARRDLAALLAAGDVHLCSVRDEWSGLIVPSKLQAAFGAGRPVLFVGPAGSDPGRWLAESGGGWRIEKGDADGLLRALEAAEDPSERRRRGAAAREYAARHFDRETNCARMAALLEQAAASR
jgi:colanic acid biosynthesis glycosyl transferase WcaI